MKIIIFLLFTYVNSEPLYFVPKHIEISCLDSKSTCPENSTCCPMPTGDYGCCNSPKAVCCLDKRHCCPEGTVCDLVTSSCTNSTNSQILPFTAKIKIRGTDECPDEKSCLDSQTCCQMPDGDYGCCPLKNAVCCDDHINCCPTGTTCDVPNKSCRRGLISIPWMRKLNTQEKLKDHVLCPDQTYCEEGQTCCQLASGYYACCPFQDAVCCNDEEHCCPMDTTCDLTTLTCKKHSSLVPYLHSKSKDVTCPDGLSFCDDKQTCCLMLSGQYGCCPFENGVCCSDMLHCCPGGQICDIDEGMCKSHIGSAQKAIFTINLVARPLAKKNLRSVICPDHSMCDDDQTCCQASSMTFACCPMPNAVCCSDNQHCCPQETTCDLAHKTCKSDREMIPWAVKVPSKMITPIPNIISNNDIINLHTKTSKQNMMLKSVTCPDQSSCNDDQTCCQISSIAYACCPMPNAVCCSDMLHCCPEKTTCDLAHESCRRNGGLFEWSAKVPSKMYTLLTNRISNNDVTDVLDKTLNKNAVCCDDGIHCCKHGQHCDTVHMRCVTTKILEEKPLKNLKDLNVVKCDNSHYCNEGEMCCPNHSTFNCCPFSNGKCCHGNTCCKNMCFFFGTCLPSTNKPVSMSIAQKIKICSDGLNFCDDGFECDLTTNMCIRKQLFFDIWNKMDNKNNSIVSNDDTELFKCENTDVQCSVDQKCCKNKHLGLGCCPFKNGVCCDTEYGCCPEGTTCSFDGRCRNYDNSISLSPTTLYHVMRKTSTFEEDKNTHVNEQCSDKSFCPSDTTCCIQIDGQFGCCQYPNAMCCEDKIHCCPSGYECDVAHQQCKEKGVKTSSSLPWFIFTRNKAKFLP